LPILFDKNVPVGVRRFLLNHEVHTLVEMQWPEQLENGELLRVAERSGFDVMVTSDQNIRYQQNLTGRKLALVVLGSNIWPLVRDYGTAISAKVDLATPGGYDFIEMPVPPETPKRRGLIRSTSSSTEGADTASTSNPPNVHGDAPAWFPLLCVIHSEVS
jgi:hypothetical protein